MSKKRCVPESAAVMGRNLRDIRVSHKYSQRQIAEKLGVSFQQVQKYENGQNRLPVENLLKLKTLYDAPYDIFFKGMQEEGNVKKSSQDIAYLCFLEIKACRDPAFQKKLYNAITALLN